MSDPAKQWAAQSSDAVTEAPTEGSAVDSELPTSREHEVPSSQKPGSMRVRRNVPESGTMHRALGDLESHDHDTIPSPPPDDIDE
jgi:hypothetical protein